MSDKTLMRFPVLALCTDPVTEQILIDHFGEIHRIENLDVPHHFISDEVVVVGGAALFREKGIQWLKKAQAIWPFGKWIITADGATAGAAVTAFRDGATDFIELPCDPVDLVKAVKYSFHAIQTERNRSEQIQKLNFRIQKLEGKAEDRIIVTSKSETMKALNEKLFQLRKSALRGEKEPSVLILGEAGCGAELFARKIHQGSRRSQGPWMTLNCANLREIEFDVEVFGHEKRVIHEAGIMKPGLLEIAQGGTLFLNEITSLTLEMQAKIDQLLETQTFVRLGGESQMKLRVRLIASGPPDLENWVKRGKFHEGLYRKLSRNVLTIPALSSRKEDILPMANSFAERDFKSRGRVFEGFTLESKNLLLQYSWPGNIQELIQVISRAALIHNGAGKVNLRPLGLESGLIEQERKKTFTGLPSKESLPTYTEQKKRKYAQLEKDYLIEVLNRFHGNVSAAAREAKMDRSNFLRLLRKYGLRSSDFRRMAA